jgi:DNA processing protein
MIEHWQEQGIGLLVLGEPRYPKLLSELSDPPMILTYRSKRKLCDLNRLLAISIVGSRQADREGVEIADAFGEALASNGVTVVSGLALGIDGAAHRGALRGAQCAPSETPPTIAICGNGLRSVYPRTHEALARDLLESGGIMLSQFDPNEPPYPVNFLNRNRLIAALSLGTIVIQASEKSGSLVTARNALEYGRELFILPGSIKDPRYLGSNKLLQHGAHLVTQIDDIFEHLPELSRARTVSPHASAAAIGAASSPRHAHWLLAALSQKQALHLDEARNHSPNQEQFFSELLALELAGSIVRLPGNMLALSTKTRLGC